LLCQPRRVALAIRATELARCPSTRAVRWQVLCPSADWSSPPCLAASVVRRGRRTYICSETAVTRPLGDPPHAMSD
jgi:hypothetical protein